MREAIAAGLDGMLPSDSPLISGGGGGSPTPSRFSRDAKRSKPDTGVNSPVLMPDPPALGAGLGAASGGLGGGTFSGSGHLVDPGPFLAADPATHDSLLPVANVSAIMTDFNWDSFNASFEPSPTAVGGGGGGGGAAGGSHELLHADGGSAWAKVCKEVGVRLASKSNLGPRPNLGWGPQ